MKAFLIISASLVLSSPLLATPNYYYITDNSSTRTEQNNYGNQPGNNDENVSNEQLLNQIQYTLKGSFKNYNLNINVEDGVVTLSGVVNSDSDKSSLESKVKNIRGVRKVNNQLQVGTLKPLPQNQGQQQQ